MGFYVYTIAGIFLCLLNLLCCQVKTHNFFSDLSAIVCVWKNSIQDVWLCFFLDSVICLFFNCKDENKAPVV